MNAIKVETIVNEAMAQAIPALRPLLGQRVEVIALQTEQPPTKRITLDEFLTHRLVPPHGVRLSLEDIGKRDRKERGRWNGLTPTGARG